MNVEKKNKMLLDPSFTAENKLAPHSNHEYFKTEEEALQQASSTLEMSLNGKWNFKYIKGIENTENNFKDGIDGLGFTKINVPGHIELNGFGIPQYVNIQYPWDGLEQIVPPSIPEVNIIGQYYREFSLPFNFSDMDIQIDFSGVEISFCLWVNGKYVGYSEDSQTRASFDISDYVNSSGINSVAVEVYKYSSATWLEDQDCWRFFGIHRDVTLKAIPKLHIEDLKVQTMLTNEYNDAIVSVDLKTRVNSLIKDQAKCQYKYKLLNYELQTVATVQSDKCHCELGIGAVNLWSAENPYLYMLLIEVWNEGTLYEVVKQKIGIREFKIENNIMKINGQRILFKGVNRHDFSPVNGKAVTKEEMLWDIKFLKANNFNSVRTSHYPNQDYWYELCDEYGLYVIDEANVETHGSEGQALPGEEKGKHTLPHNKPEWKRAILERASNMLEAHKNHPSVLIWSCGNESFAGSVFMEMANLFRSLDPTRIVHYEGVWWDRSFDAITDIESRMYATPDGVVAELEREKNKPFILCEYSHAMGNSCGGIENYVNLWNKEPRFQGGFIWEYRDHGLLSYDGTSKKYNYGGDYGDRPTDGTFVFDGLLKADNTITPKVQEVKYWYQDFKLNVLLDKVEIVNQSLFTNLSNFELKIRIYLNGDLVDTLSKTIDGKPGNTVSTQYSYNFNQPGNYSIIASLELGHGTKYANKGHEVAFGQIQHVVKEKVIKKFDSSHRKLKLVMGDINYGVIGDDFRIMFDREKGIMTSLKYADSEYITNNYCTLIPNFWRGVTDNDRGANKHIELYQWKIASMYGYAEFKVMKAEKVGDSILLTSIFEYNLKETVTSTIEYEINSFGEIKVKHTLLGAEKIGDMFAFGMMMKIPKQYSKTTWLGCGPLETHSDRFKGAKITKHTEYVSDIICNTRPQEYGNHMKTNWFEIEDNHSHGLKFIANDEFEFSCVRFDAHQLEAAYYETDLPTSSYTVINIHKKQAGIGGDDSWGTWTYEKVDIEEKMEFEFKLVPLN